MAHPRRRRDRRAARRAADQGPHRAGAAHRARPERRVDPVGAGGRRPAARRGTPARARRRRAGDRHRPGRPPAPTPSCCAQITGEKPTVVLSDEKAALEARSRSSPTASARWMVAVRMVSEGVDVPRLAVGVYATTTSTPLFFAQAVGRFVRARARGETASVFLPSVPMLLALAAEMEVERDHVLGRTITDEDDIFAAEDDLLAQAQAGERRRRRGSAPFEALGSEARFDRVLYDGGEFGHEGEVHVGSEEEMDFLGIPGLLEPDQVRELLRPATVRAARSPSHGRLAEPDTVAARRPPTSSSRCCAASSTGWSPRGTTAPASRTASPTPRCARSAAGRRRPSPPPTSCRPGSTCCASGRPAYVVARGVTALRAGLVSAHARRDLADPGPWPAVCCGARPALPEGSTVTELADRLERQPHRRLPAGRPRSSSTALVRRDTRGRGCTSGSGVLHLRPRSSRCCATSPHRCCAGSPRRSAAPRHLTVADGEEALALAVVEPSLDRLPRQLPGRGPDTRSARARPARRSCSAASRPTTAPPYVVTAGELQAGAAGPGRAGAGRRRPRGERRHRHPRRPRRIDDPARLVARGRVAARRRVRSR